MHSGDDEKGNEKLKANTYIIFTRPISILSKQKQIKKELSVKVVRIEYTNPY